MAAATPGRREPPSLVVVDQFEELFTHRTSEADRVAFLNGLANLLRVAPDLHVVITVRSDVEPQFHEGALSPWWTQGRFPMSSMTRDELRQAIERPAAAAVLYFQPSGLVERLLDDVAQVPAPLPLLSFALSELYRRCGGRWKRGIKDRALYKSDYDEMGGIAGALTQRATAVCDQLVSEEATHAITIQNLFTRMVSKVGGDIARRRVLRSELQFAESSENDRVGEVLQRFHEARLISLDNGPTGPYAEPTHDELVRGWVKVGQWLDERDANVGIEALASLGDALRAWQDHEEKTTYLWKDPRLDLIHQHARAQPLLLNADETRFVNRSMRHQRWRRIRLVLGLAIVAVVLAVLAAFALVKRQQAQERLAASYLEQGRSLWMGGHAMQGLPFLVAAKQEGDDGPVVQMLFAQAAADAPVAVLVGHSKPIMTAMLSPDGTRVVTAGIDKTARIWDARTGQQVTASLEHDGIVFTPRSARTAHTS